MVKKVVRSARGAIVDFDSLKIKEQLSSQKVPLEVKTRQNFIENRMKRRMKKKLPVIEKAEIEVEPTLPEPAEDIKQEDIISIEEVVEEVVEEEKPKKSKQKARKRNKE